MTYSRDWQGGTMGRFSFLKKDPVIERKDDRKIWLKYCGFFDLYIEEFMTIQNALLSDEIELIQKSELGKKILGSRKIENLDDFRENVPFTTYSDYQPYFDEKDESVLAEKPVLWSCTSGYSGEVKWIPYTSEMIKILADNTLSAFILSSANDRGEVKLRPGARIVFTLPPIPHTTGVMESSIEELLLYYPIPSSTQSEQMEVRERVEHGFRLALRSGIDYASGLAVDLSTYGKSTNKLDYNSQASLKTLHPAAALRQIQATIKARLANRPIMPKDLWQIKGLVCSGIDTSIYQEDLDNYWGVKPLDVYSATEACVIAMQNWNKKGMTLIPYSNFYEFIPEDESLKNQRDENYRPNTVLTDELEVNEVYEIVVTNFHGGSLVRYRIGDLIKVLSIGDEETSSTLPQIEFQGRAEEIIDINGFIRFNEKEIWSAIQDTYLPYEDWTARKERIEQDPFMHIYLELSNNHYDDRRVVSLINDRLVNMRKEYTILKERKNLLPIKVTLLKQGTFYEYSSTLLGQIKTNVYGFSVSF